MPAPEDFDEIYTDELKDLWSANDQMNRVVKKLTPKAKDPAIKEMLQKSHGGIEKHTAVLKELIAAAGEKTAKEHCKGMEGLVEETPSIVSRKRPRRGRCSTRSLLPSISA